MPLKTIFEELALRDTKVFSALTVKSVIQELDLLMNAQFVQIKHQTLSDS